MAVASREQVACAWLSASAISSGDMVTCFRMGAVAGA